MTAPDAGAGDRPAVVLLSGGLDSTTVLAIARREGYRPLRAQLPLRPAPRGRAWRGAPGRRRSSGVARPRDRRHRPARLRRLGAHRRHRVPTHDRTDELGEGIPITYVPARNTIFLSFALAWAEVLGASDIFIGVNALDYSGYPDCRPEYIAAFEAMANLATKAGVEGRQRSPHPHAADRPDQGARSSRGALALGVDYA